MFVPFMIIIILLSIFLMLTSSNPFFCPHSLLNNHFLLSDITKSLVRKDGNLEQFGGVVETPGGVVPHHLHQQECGEEGTSTTTQTKADSSQGGEERKKTSEEGGEKGKGSSGTSGTKIAGRTGKTN